MQHFCRIVLIIFSFRGYFGQNVTALQHGIMSFIKSFYSTIIFPKPKALRRYSQVRGDIYKRYTVKGFGCRYKKGLSLRVAKRGM